jgi:hypothetical protein
MGIVAVAAFAKLTGRRPAEISLDLAHIRRTLDGMVPAQAKVSRKRWANPRSDLAAAFDASGLRPMLKTAGVDLDDDWATLFRAIDDRRVLHGLSRFARWASLRRITPAAVHNAVIERFIAELEASSLIRDIGAEHRSVALTWNILCARQPGSRLAPAVVPTSKLEPTRVPWERLPASFVRGCSGVQLATHYGSAHPGVPSRTPRFGQSSPGTRSDGLVSV